MLTVLQEIVFCFHLALLAVKYLMEKGALNYESTYGCFIIAEK